LSPPTLIQVFGSRKVRLLTVEPSAVRRSLAAAPKACDILPTTNGKVEGEHAARPATLGRKKGVPLTREAKAEVIEKNRIHPTDTGSADIQVAVLTERIRQLQGHLEVHKQDNHTRRGLLAMVGKRRRLLNYLARNDHERYRDLIGRLGLRR
jgi:small subunit ribosomal protein S15